MAILRVPGEKPDLAGKESAMAFCSNCGTEMGEGVRFCPKCGREVSSGPGATPSPPTPGGTPAAGGLTNNVAGLLCYVLGLITGILFLVLEPYNRDPFIRFHAFQSIFFHIAAIVLIVVVGMIPFVGWLLSPLVGLGLFAGWVLLMVQAYQNKKWKLPVLGDLAEKQR